MIDEFNELGEPDFSDMEVEEARGLLGGSGKRPDLPEIYREYDLEIGGPGGSLVLRVYRPSTASQLPALVWFHGGGWVLGDLDASDLAGRHLANAASCVVVSVDYRLAPETPFPGAFDDCWAATRWVIDHGDDDEAGLDTDPSRVAVGGSSAGANLAAAVALEAARQGVDLAGQLLASPVTTDDRMSPSMIENASGYLLTRDGMSWFWDHYAQGADRSDRRIAPLDGLGSIGADRAIAPAWIYTAGFDPLRDQGLAYAAALRDRSVEVTHMHVADVIHGVFSGELRCGVEARIAAADWLRTVLG